MYENFSNLNQTLDVFSICHVIDATCVNIPLMRQNELLKDVNVFNEDKNRVLDIFIYMYLIKNKLIFYW